MYGDLFSLSIFIEFLFTCNLLIFLKKIKNFTSIFTISYLKTNK